MEPWVLNMTTQPATPHQLSQGIVDPPEPLWSELQQLLQASISAPPGPAHMDIANQIVTLVKSMVALDIVPQVDSVIIDGPPWTISALTRAFQQQAIPIRIAFPQNWR